jgi:hypothetical protein
VFDPDEIAHLVKQLFGTILHFSSWIVEFFYLSVYTHIGVNARTIFAPYMVFFKGDPMDTMLSPQSVPTQLEAFLERRKISWTTFSIPIPVLVFLLALPFSLKLGGDAVIEYAIYDSVLVTAQPDGTAQG